MCRSARRSSSPVLTPGRSSDSTSARTSATTRPARRIRAISAGDLTVNCRERATAMSADGPDAGQHVADRIGDLRDGAPAVDGRENPPLAVVGDDVVQGGKLLGEPGADRLHAIVVALVEWRAVD